MNPPPRPAPSHVPTLTEVIELHSELPSERVAEEGAAVPQAFVQDTPVTVPPPNTSPPQPAVVAPLGGTPAPVHVPVVPTPSAWPEPAPPVSVPAVPVAMPPLAAAPSPQTPASPPLVTPPALPPRASSGVDEAAMAQRVLTEVQRQIDGMLEYRLREALTPILARTSEALVRELRQELSKTMRDVVSRAVAQEVARQRTRP